jgi:hypothetical protein
MLVMLNLQNTIDILLTVPLERAQECTCVNVFLIDLFLPTPAIADYISLNRPIVVHSIILNLGLVRVDFARSQRTVCTIMKVCFPPSPEIFKI